MSEDEQEKLAYCILYATTPLIRRICF